VNNLKNYPRQTAYLSAVSETTHAKWIGPSADTRHAFTEGSDEFPSPPAIVRPASPSSDSDDREPSSEPDIRLFKILRMYCQASAIAAVGVGCLVLCGWAFHIELWKSVFPGLVAMKANTALGLAFSGASLWLLLPGASRTGSRRIAHLLAFLVTLIGAATLGEYLFGVNLRIDQLLFTEPVGAVATYSSGRMAPTTSTAFLAMGLALLLLDWKTRRGHRPAQVLSLWVALVATMAISGYIYSATALDRILLYTQVAVHTAIVLFLLSVAIFFARPRTGIARDLTSEGSGSVMARRLLPAVFYIPILLGWIELRGRLAGMYGPELGLALYATGTIVVFVVLVWLSARKINVEYSQRSRVEVAIRELNADLEGRVVERTKSLAQQAAVLTEQAALLDLAQDAIVVRDMNSRILFWNRGAEAMYGWPSEEALGKNTYELLKTEFYERTKKIEAKLLHQGQLEDEAIHHRRDGTRLIVASRWTLQRDADGAPVRILTINNDITNRKKAEEALRNSETQLLQKVGELKRSNDELQQFAYVASHDLQEPLRMVASYLQLLAERYKGRLDSDADEFIAYAVDGSNRMKALIEDLLAYSRVGTNGRALREISSENALQLALTSLQVTVEESGAVVTHDSLPAITTDGTQLAQVFQNLIGNAIKYRSAEVPHVHVSATKNGDKEWIFSVRDNGIGIDPQYFEKIFVLFQRLHGRAEFTGTGIGLAICKKILERLGGRIWVESQPEKGSTFYFALLERDGK